MTKDEALMMALEALRQIDEAMPFPVAKLAQKVIKEALAQPEQSQVEEMLRYEIDALEAKLAECRAQHEPVATSDTLQERVDETAKQRHEQEPVIDKPAAIQIATALGWEPKRTITSREVFRIWR